jgi:hypothetical protein
MTTMSDYRQVRPCPGSSDRLRGGPFLLESRSGRTSTGDAQEAIGLLTQWSAEAAEGGPVGMRVTSTSGEMRLVTSSRRSGGSLRVPPAFGRPVPRPRGGGPGACGLCRCPCRLSAQVNGGLVIYPKTGYEILKDGLARCFGELPDDGRAREVVDMIAFRLSREE